MNLVERIKELENEVSHLNDEISYKDDQIEKYENAVSLLHELLEAEKKADKLERETKSDLAYDLWHLLRRATATVHDMVYPPQRVIRMIEVDGMTTRVVTMVPQYRLLGGSMLRT